ncbi:uncharacterized protein MONOS_12861 [Monocercomonoides exilis]|uniref:uncharacterized protein n=1 Tax=Monocercomonoides exilis TaxID=2049356 RepID=UPI00355A36AD|nr:hypothetical protein MONOS_12861 [Monocercomonoides exilis]
MKSEKGETDAFVFRRFLPNNCRAEAAKLKEEMKVLYDVKCSGNAWTSSFLPSEAAFRGIVFGELESLLCVLSADSKGAVAADLPGCVPAIGLWRTVSRIGTDVLPAQQHLRAIPVAAEAGAVRLRAGAIGSVGRCRAEAACGGCIVGGGEERRRWGLFWIVRLLVEFVGL